MYLVQYLGYCPGKWFWLLFGKNFTSPDFWICFIFQFWKGRGIFCQLSLWRDRAGSWSLSGCCPSLSLPHTHVFHWPGRAQVLTELPPFSFKAPRMLYLCLADSSFFMLGFPKDRKHECPISMPSTCWHPTWNYSVVILLDCSAIHLSLELTLKKCQTSLSVCGPDQHSDLGLVCSGD